MAGETGYSLEQQATERQIREETIHRDGKEIAVVGIDHGILDYPFPGREVAEESLRRGLQGPPRALLIDSLYSLTEKEADGSYYGQDEIKQAISSARPISELDFHHWAMRYAYEEDATIILGDPTNSNNPNYFPYLKDQLEEVQNVQIDIPVLENQVASSPPDSESTPVSKVSTVDTQKHEVNGNLLRRKEIILTSALITSLAGVGLYKLRRNDRLTRRNFLKKSIKTGVGIAVAGSVLSSGDDAMAAQSKEEIEETHESNDYFDKLMQSAEALTQADHQSEIFKRIAQHSIDRSPLSLLLRNAIMADVLCANREELIFDSPQDEVAIGAVVGGSHVILPEEFSISSLVQNDKNREEALTVLLASVLKGAEDLLGAEERLALAEQLRTFAKSYKIHADGSVDVKRIHPPLLTKLLGSDEMFGVATDEQESSVLSETPATEPTVAYATETPIAESSPTATESDISTPTEVIDEGDTVEIDTLKAIRAKHLLKIYAQTMDEDTYGRRLDEGFAHGSQVQLFREIVKGCDEINDNKLLAGQLLAVLNLLNPGLKADPESVNGNSFRGGLAQLDAWQLQAAGLAYSYDDMISMPSVEQLKEIVIPVLKYYQNKIGLVERSDYKIEKLEDLAMIIIYPSAHGEYVSADTPLFNREKDSHLLFYKRVVSVLEKAGKKPVEDGSLSKEEITDAIRLEAVSLGEDVVNLP